MSFSRSRINNVGRYLPELSQTRFLKNPKILRDRLYTNESIKYYTHIPEEIFTLDS